MLLASIAAGALLAGCRGDRSDSPPRQFIPDMDDSPKWDPQAGSDFYADSRMLRPTPEGTVPFGIYDFDPVAFERQYGDEQWAESVVNSRADLLKNDSAFFYGLDEQGEFLDRAPVEFDRDLILRGQERFNIYCSVCHGYFGDGQGMVGNRWAYLPANFHDPKYADPNERTGKDGYLFNVARNGVWDNVETGGAEPVFSGTQKMPSYGHAVDERDAWAIVAYIRVLQASRTDIDSIPQDAREQLRAARDALPGQTRTASAGTDGNEGAQ
jgi:mono/diheme cytochrome c family protein